MTKDTRSISLQNQGYPTLLKKIPDAPAKLYYKGIWEERLFADCLAVVGSRHMTSYGKRATEKLVGEVAQAGVTIVSGFMYGIDAMAHTFALQAGGKTIAVMPCGIERIHPEYQKDLYENILRTNGLILSEWEGNAMPTFWMYPKRNRIVAGLCKATLVVEAGVESGSLITAEFAKKFERKIFAVPGPITSKVSLGTAKLIREGAFPVTSGSDILEYYGKNGLFERKTRPAALQNAFEQKVLEVLQRESLEVDLLARALGVQAAQLGTTLSLLELRGIIKQEGGKYYAH